MIGSIEGLAREHAARLYSLHASDPLHHSREEVLEAAQRCATMCNDATPDEVRRLTAEIKNNLHRHFLDFDKQRGARAAAAKMAEDQTAYAKFAVECGESEKARAALKLAAQYNEDFKNTITKKES